VQVPHSQLLVHTWNPVPLLQHCTSPDRHAKPSSTLPSQSSSMPLHVSVGGVQLLQVQVELQVREPVDPQEVVHVPAAPLQQPKSSSQAPSQSSSDPLHTSLGAAQLPHAQAVLHTREPVVPQDVVHDSVTPLQQANPSSQVPSQSSSAPLHVSEGGAQAVQAQELLQLREPVVPHEVVQLPVSPRQHSNPLSQSVSQSSSSPLQVSTIPPQASHRHPSVQDCVDTAPQGVVQLRDSPVKQSEPDLSAHSPSVPQTQSLVQVLICSPQLPAPQSSDSVSPA